MIPATIDFLLRTNADYGEVLQFTDGSNGPIDLNGKSFAMQVRLFPGGPFLFDVPLKVIDAADGQLQVGPILGKPNAGDYSHDLIVTQDGLREVWAQGVVQIQQGVTTNG